jgi:hypothetical protein
MKARRLMAIPSEWTLRLTHSEARRDQCAHVAERRGLLSPEFSFRVFVTLKLAKLNRVAVNNAPKVHFQEVGIPIRPGRADRTKYKTVASPATMSCTSMRKVPPDSSIDFLKKPSTSSWPL